MSESHIQGFDPSTSPAEIQNLLVNFMGQTYAEINKLDKNIVGTSNNLIQKGGEFKNLAQTVINNVPNNFTFNARPQPPIQQAPPPAAPPAPPAPPAYVAHVSEQYNIVEPSNPEDSGQLLFDFDNSATAVKIDAALSRIESCLTKIENKLSKNDKSIAEITAAITKLSSSIDNVSKEKKQRKTDSIY